MAPLTILSYNVRGLNSRQKRLRTRLFLENLHQKPDLVCIQEHKLRGSGLSKLEHEVWPAASWHSAPAADGSHARRNHCVSGGQGGLAVAIGNRLTPYISASGTLSGGGAIWIQFENDRLGRMGFVGIYAPNSSSERCVLWQDLFLTLDPRFQWIFGGDFNMIENLGDQCGRPSSIIAGSERRA